MAYDAAETLDQAISLLDAIISRLRDPDPIQHLRVPPKTQCSSSTEKLSESPQVQPVGAPSEGSAPRSGEESSEDFDKAHLQVGCVVTVDNHPVSDKLYVCKVEISKGEFKQVVAGLRKFLPPAELLGKKVCLVLNLKPAKLAGQLSEAMILAGETSDSSNPVQVKILQPPVQAAIGDRIFLEGSAPSAKPPKQLSSKIWEKIVPLLCIQGGIAKFGSRSMVTSSGVVMAPDLPDGASVH